MTISVRRELHKAGFHGRAAIRKPYKNKCLKFPGVSIICPTPVSGSCLRAQKTVEQEGDGDINCS